MPLHRPPCCSLPAPALIHSTNGRQQSQRHSGTLPVSWQSLSALSQRQHSRANVRTKASESEVVQSRRELTPRIWRGDPAGSDAPCRLGCDHQPGAPATGPSLPREPMQPAAVRQPPARGHSDEPCLAPAGQGFVSRPFSSRPSRAAQAAVQQRLPLIHVLSASASFSESTRIFPSLI